MEDSKFVPTLTELLKADGNWGIQCHWKTKGKGRHPSGRCGNNIKASDVEERDQLIASVRVLIGHGVERGSLVRATPDIVSKIHDALKKVSMWFLCKIRHRVYSNIIVKKWCDELNQLDDLDDLNESAARLTRANPRRESKNPNYTNTTKETNIRQELNNLIGRKDRCHGKNKDGASCARLISRKNCDQAAAIIEGLSKLRNISQAIENDLSLLAGLLLCQRSHQGQVAAKAEEWLGKLRDYLSLPQASPGSASEPDSSSVPQNASNRKLSSISEPTPKSEPSSTSWRPSTPSPRRTRIVGNETPESAASSIFSTADSTPFDSPVTPPTTGPSNGRHRYGTRAGHVDSPSLSMRDTRRSTHAPTDTPPQSPRSPTDSVPQTPIRITRSSTFTIPPTTAIQKFKPFDPKSTNIRMKIYEKFTRTIIPREESPGYIYGFQREGEKKHIKVGFTCNFDKRINEWRKKCSQNVKVVLAEYLPHAAKVESLVHSILHRERQREILIGGRCNGGKGCATKHMEWFAVTVEFLRDIVNMCKKWILSVPYDEDGKLQEIWLNYVNKLYENPSRRHGEDWRDWFDVQKMLEAPVASIVVPSEIKERVAATTVTEREIKSESDDTPLANATRVYAERIAQIKDEVPGGMALDNLPGVPSGPLDDPFVTPVVTAVSA